MVLLQYTIHYIIIIMCILLFFVFISSIASIIATLNAALYAIYIDTLYGSFRYLN